MILDGIKKANVQAIKDKDNNARAIYSIVMTKATLETVKKREKGEEFADADMVQIIQKTIKELKDEEENYKKANNQEKANEILEQQNLISKYLPQMMSEDEIYKIISEQEDKSIPNIMRYFKANYAGKVEMAKVQQVLKRFN